MEGDKVAIIFINTGSGDNGAAKITANIFGNDFWIAFIGFGVDVEAMFMVFIAGCFYFFERRAECCLRFIQKSSAKGIAEVSVIRKNVTLRLTPQAIQKAKALGKGYSGILSRIIESVLDDPAMLSKYL